MLKHYALLIIFMFVGSLESSTSRCRQAGQRLYQRMLDVTKQTKTIRPTHGLKCPLINAAGTNQKQKSYQQCWDRCKKPVLGIAAAGITAGTIQFLLERNRRMQEEIKKTISPHHLAMNDQQEEEHKKQRAAHQKAHKELEEALKNNLSGIHYKKNPYHNKGMHGQHITSRLDHIRLSVKDQFIEALKKEEQLLKEGYICFYHAQHSMYGSINDVLNEVFFKLAGEQQPHDFRLLQIRSKDFKKQSIASRNKEHDILMKADSDDIPKPLAVNLFAFGNEGYGQDTGSSTLYYLTENTNCYKFNMDIFVDALFAMGLPQESSLRFQNLIGDIKAFNRTEIQNGRLLLIAVPKNNVDKYVFPACYSETVTTEDGKTIGIGDQRKPIIVGTETLYTITDIITYAQKNSVTSLEECKCEGAMPIDTVGLLNPYSGIKIFALDDQHIPLELKKQLTQAKQNLVDAIMAEFKRTGTLEKAQKNVRDHIDELAIIECATIAESNKTP